MKMKNNILRIINNSLLLVFLAFVSCDNFDDINTNPDAATNPSPSMICTNVVLKTVKFNGRDAMAFLDANLLAKYVGFANQSQQGSQYNSISNSDFGGMTLLPNIDQMVKNSEGNIMQNSYKGIGKFASSWMFYNLTMQMGDIPYSEANQGEMGNFRPKYDTQEQVFIGILNELKEADGFFASGVTFDGDPTPYAGNPDKWRRASNAFALKVLMSLSKKADVASLNVKGRFAEIVAGGRLLEPNTGFLGLNYSTVNMHPLSGTNDLFTSRTDVSSLLIDHLKSLNDRRLFYVADPSAKQKAAGLAEGDMAAYVGVDVSIDYAAMTAQHLLGAYSLLNSRYLKEATSEPRMMVTYAEQQLILAEARIRGWITTGNAKDYYESGVKSALAAMMATKASYAHGKPIDQAYIDSYFTGEAAFKATTDEQLKQIWLQRYVLNFMQDATHSYYEFRRTGFPVFPLNPITNLNQNNPNGFPMRWLYPGSETNTNRENMKAALDRQFDGYDEVNKIMWIIK